MRPLLKKQRPHNQRSFLLFSFLFAANIAKSRRRLGKHLLCRSDIAQADHTDNLSVFTNRQPPYLFLRHNPCRFRYRMLWRNTGQFTACHNLPHRHIFRGISRSHTAEKNIPVGQNPAEFSLRPNRNRTDISLFLQTGSFRDRVITFHTDNLIGHNFFYFHENPSFFTKLRKKSFRLHNANGNLSFFFLPVLYFLRKKRFFTDQIQPSKH